MSGRQLVLLAARSITSSAFAIMRMFNVEASRHSRHPLRAASVNGVPRLLAWKSDIKPEGTLRWTFHIRSLALATSELWF